jgi:hypothetical protein
VALTTAGKTLIAARIIGTSLAAVDTTTGYLGVGNSSTAFSAAHTDLQGASKTRKQLTTSSVSSADMTFITTFASGDANHAWDEFGVFNHASAGTMLCRKVAAHGTKASGDSWTLTVVVTVG